MASGKAKGVPRMTRKKKGKKEQTIKEQVIEEVKDFFLIVGVAALLLTLGFVYWAYLVSGTDHKTTDYLSTSAPRVTCETCSWEMIDHLNVITSGDKNGEMLVFLHGFPETALMTWYNQIDYFSNMGYFVVAPDMRGYNTSVKFSSTSDYHLDYLAEDVIGLINHFEKETASVVAHDWGGAVAWHLGQYHEEKIDKLVILDCPHPGVMKSYLRSSWTQISKSWYIFFFQIPFLPESKLYGDNFQFLQSAVIGNANIKKVHQSTVDLYIDAWSQEGAVGAMLSYYRSVFRNIFSSSKRVSVPTLVMWGNEDVALSTEMAQDSINECDYGKVIVLEGASHWLPREVPERVNSEIADFLM